MVLQNTFFSRIVLGIEKRDPPALIDGFVDSVHDVVALFVVGLHPVSDYQVAFEHGCVPLAGQASELRDQALDFECGNKFGSFHSIDEQLDFRQFEQACPPGNISFPWNGSP